MPITAVRPAMPLVKASASQPRAAAPVANDTAATPQPASKGVSVPGWAMMGVCVGSLGILCASAGKSILAGGRGFGLGAIALGSLAVGAWGSFKKKNYGIGAAAVGFAGALVSAALKLPRVALLGSLGVGIAGSVYGFFHGLSEKK